MHPLKFLWYLSFSSGLASVVLPSILSSWLQMLVQPRRLPHILLPFHPFLQNHLSFLLFPSFRPCLPCLPYLPYLPYLPCLPCLPCLPFLPCLQILVSFLQTHASPVHGTFHVYLLGS